MKSKYSVKKWSVAICASLLTVSVNVQAQIPTTDIAHIVASVLNQVESIAKWTQQFQQMQQQIQQYQQQYNAVVGSRGLGALLDNTGLTAALPNDWQNILADVKKTNAYVTERKKYPTFSDGAPKVNAMYDLIASQNAVMTDLYSKSSHRLNLIKSLTSEIDTAYDPAAKADLANRLISEQNAIQGNQNLVTILQSRQRQELEYASQEASKELTCKEFKRTGC
ncbi:MAG: type IV secretion system protein [Pseudomonadota bacterium]